MNQFESSKYINETEVSTITGFSKSLLQNWRWLGKGIPYYKVSKKVLYRKSDVINYIEQYRIVPQDLPTNDNILIQEQK
jgi:hypothetical protein